MVTGKGPRPSRAFFMGETTAASDDLPHSRMRPGHDPLPSRRAKDGAGTHATCRRPRGVSILAHALKDPLRPGDSLTVVTKDPINPFVPSNPWIADGWRGCGGIPIDLAPLMPPALRGENPCAGSGAQHATRLDHCRVSSAQPHIPEHLCRGSLCVANPPMGQTPVPMGVPGTGFMITSLLTATADNIGNLLRGNEPDRFGTGTALSLADGGAALVAQPQNPPRTVNPSSSGKWLHLAKVGFDTTFCARSPKARPRPFPKASHPRCRESTN